MILGFFFQLDVFKHNACNLKVNWKENIELMVNKEQREIDKPSDVFCSSDNVLTTDYCSM